MNLTIPENLLADHEDPTDQAQVWPIILIIIGLIVVLIMLFLIYWFCYRKKKLGPNQAQVSPEMPKRLSLLGKQYQPDFELKPLNADKDLLQVPQKPKDFRQSFYMFHEDDSRSRKSSRSSKVLSMLDIESLIVNQVEEASVPLASTETLEIWRPLSTFEPGSNFRIEEDNSRPQSDGDLCQADEAPPKMPAKRVINS